MTAPPRLAPDAIQPFSGYRMWTYVLGRTAALHSMTCSGSRDCPWANSATDWVQASCNLNGDPWHAAPDEACSCGIYAVSTVDELLMHFAPVEMADGTGSVMGRVELAGKVIEHEYGFRAERARIAELLPFEGRTRDVIRLADRLGVPLGKLVPPPEIPPLDIPPLQLQALRMISSGWTTREIATALTISRYKVRRSLEQVLGVLRAHPPAGAPGRWRPPPAA